MYSIEDIREMIKRGENTIKEVVEVELGNVMNNSFDDLIDLLEEGICEYWLPKLDCSYDLVGCTKGFYYATLRFEVEILIDAETFLSEYEDF